MLSQTFKAGYYFFKEEDREEESNFCNANPDVEHVRMLWNLGE